MSFLCCWLFTKKLSYSMTRFHAIDIGKNCYCYKSLLADSAIDVFERKQYRLTINRKRLRSGYLEEKIYMQGLGGSENGLRLLLL